MAQWLPAASPPRHMACLCEDLSHEVDFGYWGSCNRIRDSPAFLAALASPWGQATLTSTFKREGLPCAS